MEKFDAIIIGSGQAGNPLAKRLSQEGLRVALIESAHIGGTCINYGCTPTKTLIGLAKIIHQAGTAESYGIVIDNPVPDYKLIRQRKDEVVGIYRAALEKQLVEDANITILCGHARFSGFKEIQVQQTGLPDTFITAELIFINSGARPDIPDIAGLPSVHFLSSQSILEIDDLPKELLIIGGGYVSLEFAQLFQRLGSQVTILEQSERLLSREDEDVSLEIREILSREGVNIITGARPVRVFAHSKKAVSVEILVDGVSKTVSGSDLLVATGRKPNTEDLQLAKTAVAQNENGFIIVNDYLETSVPGIFALGDVKGGPAFTHVSYHDYLVITGNLFDKKKISIRNRLIPYCVFLDPELGRVGLTERQAAALDIDFAVAKMDNSFIARAVETGATSGFIKALVDVNTRKILGAAIICPNGGELMSLFQVAMMGGLCYDQLRDNMFAHPTYAEAINNLFQPVHLHLKSKL